MATGCGKTVVFSELAKDEVTGGGRVLILAHTDELIDQALDKFHQTTGMHAGREKAESYASRFERVVVGSVQSMQGTLRLSSWPKDYFSIVVVDEAHHALADGYQKVLQHFISGGARVVGVTATADRGDKRGLGEFFHRVAYDYGLLRAVRDGWLVRPIVKTMPVQIDLRGVTTKTTAEGNDLDRGQVGQRLIPLLDAIADAIRAEIQSEKVLIFMPSVETAQLMSGALDDAGVTSEWVCGDRKLCPDRAERVARHRQGKFQALTNMAVLTEGYDDDSIRNIICLRATKIRSLYAQIIGRGTRPIADIVAQLNAAASAAERVQLIARSTKPHVRVMDFIWLYEKHDLCSPATLVTKDVRVAELMAGKDGDLMDLEAQAEVDLLKKLEEEVKKNARRKSQTVDPLALATHLRDVELADYEPVTAQEAAPITDKQRRILEGNGIKVDAVKGRGHASLIIRLILERHAKGLATVRQINFFRKLGIDATAWTRDHASQAQHDKIAEWQARRAAKQLPLDSSALPRSRPAQPNPNDLVDDLSALF
jgi:superfamily II DNA or RNA helicase